MERKIKCFPLGCSGSALLMVCTSALSVGSFRMSVRKSAVNEKKDAVCSVTLLL